MPQKVNQIRLQNLEILIREAGSLARLARATGANSSYLSQVRNQLPAPSGNPRCIGKGLAAKLERATGKPPGWMDLSHADSTQDTIQTETARQGSWQQDLIPVVSWVQAGNWRETVVSDVPFDEVEWAPCPTRCSPRSFALRVRGASMEPQFHEGDLIYVDPEVIPEHGRFVVVQLDHSKETTFKQLIVEGGKRYLKALNPNWPNPIIEVNEDATICGVIVFKGNFV